MTDPVPLSRVPHGSRCRIVAVDRAQGGELAREGLHPGVEVTVTTRTPLGGPVVGDLGRTRIAISARLAATVATEPLEPA
jgi:Fe2+ transport system protein FeoA